MPAPNHDGTSDFENVLASMYAATSERRTVHLPEILELHDRQPAHDRLRSRAGHAELELESLRIEELGEALASRQPAIVEL